MTVDFSSTVGRIRALHGANLGPLCLRGLVDLSNFHRELRFPLTRVHDVVWLDADAVDVSAVFRDARGDPADPASYTFAETDDYLDGIAAVGSPVLYRLGESIEHTPRKYRVHPPRDPARWAEACCGIVAHCNEGWAGGGRRGIRSWEIWNEPDNRPSMWTGTDGQFFELYESTAHAIKDRWPELKVGGPALAETGVFHGDRFAAAPFLPRFLAFCRDRRVPLDFFSWHRYAAEPSDLARRARAVRALLDEHGFEAAESHCNEWNYVPGEDWLANTRDGQGIIRRRWSDEMGGPRGAAFAAWVLASLQDAPLDMANFYTADISSMGMFTFHGEPRKIFYAFRAFAALLDTPRRVRTPPCVAGGIATLAGLDHGGTRAGVLLAAFDGGGAPVPAIEARGLPWIGPTRYRVHLLDADHDLEEVRAGVLPPGSRLELPEVSAPAVALVRLAPGGP